MIERLDVHFIHAEPDEKLQKYVEKKLGKLDHYLPRAARGSAHAEVLLKTGKAGKVRDGRDCCAEVTLHLPHEVINVSEPSMNMFTAIDIVELKLKQQIKKYKETHHGGTRLRRLATRLAR